MHSVAVLLCTGGMSVSKLSVRQAKTSLSQPDFYLEIQQPFLVLHAHSP